jgi:hypothetical protein
LQSAKKMSEKRNELEDDSLNLPSLQSLKEVRDYIAELGKKDSPLFFKV